MASDIFEIFKIVLGIIIAGFFLYFMIQFAGLYTSTEAKSAEMQEYKNMKKLIEDTYIYSVPTNLDLQKPPLFAKPPYVSEGSAISVNPSILFFFKPAKRVIVYRGTADYGFWTLDFVGALPETRILYNFVVYDTEHYSMIQNLTELFPQSADPPIGFGFCNSSLELVGKSGDSRDDFLKPIRSQAKIKSGTPQNLNLLPCTASFQSPKLKVIITKTDLPVPQDGFVIKLPETGKKAGTISFMEKNRNEIIEPKTLVYKDALDIFAAIVGGSDGYNYKNKLMFDGLLLFEMSEAKRANMLIQLYSDPALKKESCQPLYNSLGLAFKSKLEPILKAKTYSSQTDMENMMVVMGEINKIYSDLKKRGCE